MNKQPIQNLELSQPQRQQKQQSNSQQVLQSRNKKNILESGQSIQTKQPQSISQQQLTTQPIKQPIQTKQLVRAKLSHSQKASKNINNNILFILLTKAEYIIYLYIIDIIDNVTLETDPIKYYLDINEQTGKIIYII